MTWNLSNLNEIAWNNLISNFKQKSFHNIYSYGEVKKNQSWNILRLIYADNYNKISAVQIIYKNKFKFTLINIPGGVEGLVNHKILKNLQNFLLNKFGRISFTIMNIPLETSTIKYYSPWKKMISSYEQNLTMKKI